MKEYSNFQYLIENYSVGLQDDMSTSIHSINGDSLSLSSTEKTLYLLWNHISNKLPTDKLLSTNFTLEKEKFNNFWNKIKGTPSPSRAMGDMFWMNLPWGDIKKNLGEVNILDIGCGAGGYCKKLQNWSNSIITSYKGLDIHQSPKWHDNINWGKEEGINVSFEQTDLDSDTTFDIPANINFLMSQSAVEHIKNDLGIFKQLKKFMYQKDEPCMQLHLFPGPASLDLYLLHGYRQYGDFAINKIVDLFSDCDVELYKICGEASNKLHFDYITKPIYLDNLGDKRDSNPEQYRELLHAALLTDLQKEIETPAFWALKIYKG